MCLWVCLVGWLAGWLVGWLVCWLVGFVVVVVVVCLFLTQSVNSSYVPCFIKITLISSIKVFSLNCPNSISNFVLISSNVCEKLKPCSL